MRMVSPRKDDVLPAGLHSRLAGPPAFRLPSLVKFRDCAQMIIPLKLSRTSSETRTQLVSTKEFASAHLVGIAGSGMKALAEMLCDLGWSITGSDLHLPDAVLGAMRSRGLRLHLGHGNRFRASDFDVLVYSPAVEPDNPERILAREMRIPEMSYSEMLGYLMRQRDGVSVAGTHGKSTTTAMVATILSEAGLSASAVIGAELCGSRRSGWAGDGDLFVVESCEYQRSFLDLAPKYAAILGIEEDHFDCYQNLGELRAAFTQFARKLPSDGMLLVRGDCAASIAVAESTSAEVVTFSQRPGADWWTDRVYRTKTAARFRVFRRGEFFVEIKLPTPGEHNVNNALAAVALSHHCGASPESIRESLQGFFGVQRRFERVGSWRGVQLVDDYAHHPTAVRAALRTAREEFGRRRIWCAFQPHQVSRTQALLKQFASSFSAADQILIAPVFAARENVTEEPVVLAEELASRVASQGGAARFCPSLDRIISTLEDEARPGDVLVTMGAGDINRVHDEFTRRLQRYHTAQ